MTIERIDVKNDREKWFALRSLDVTASVAGSLLGVHPYMTPYALWALKSGRLMEDPEETAPMRRGRLLEPVAVQILREDHPEWIFEEYPLGVYYRDTDARIGATPDVMVRDPLGHLGVVQIKNVEPSVFRRTWKDDDGELAVPLWIAVQAIIEAHLTGAQWAAVAAMVVSFGVDMPVIPVPIHAGLIERLKSEVAAFWRAVETGQAPDADYNRDSKLLEKLFSPVRDFADLSADNALVDLADERAKIAADVKKGEDRIKAIKAEFLAKLGDANAGRIADGRWLIANRVNRKGYSVEPSSYVTVTVKKGI